MTEDQWLTCVSPEEMLNHLTERASPRKLRLYAIGCCRRIWHLLRDDKWRHAVEVAQRFVDGRATPVELEAACRIAAVAAGVSGPFGMVAAQAAKSVPGAAWDTTRASAWNAAWDAAWDVRMAVRDTVPVSGFDRYEMERAWQASLLQDLFGNPFRVVTFDPTWLVCNDGAVTALARVIYEEDRFGDLPILADALEEAGCATREILDHCRARQPHYRGCWVVDTVLGYT